jgi:hypothetical protein
MADQMQPTPRSTILGLFSDIVNLPLQYMSSPERTQQMQGTAQFLYDTGIPKTLERLSYGDSLFSGSGMTLRPREETINAAMNVAPFVKPAAVMANRAAMSAGRAGERLAERVVPQVMSRGGLGSQLLSDVSRGSVSPLDVYHGTPHTLPPTPRNPLGEFDASKIGTGEGAQAYGYGIYTAENPAVAREYQQKLSSTGSAKNLASQYGGIDEGLAEAESRVENYKQIIANGGGGSMSRAKSMLQIAEKNVEDLKAMKAGLPENTGSLYKIDLPDEKIATMLDWDKPVSQQNNVMNALRNEAEQRVKSQVLVDIENDIRSKLPVADVGDDYLSMFGGQNVSINQDIRQQALDRLNQLDLRPLVDKELDSFKPLDMNWNMSGKDFYEILSARSGSAQQASNILQQQGIAGIKYLDEGSRATTGAKTSNFVVFPNEEKSMTILERNGVRAFPEPPVEQSINDFSYRGSHTAPSSEFGAPLYDLTGGGQMYPADVYSAKAAQYYGSGNIRADLEAFNLAKRVRGNPDAEVTIYRAVPKNADISNINAGDWVTLTKDYAKGHGESVLRGDYKILSQKVKAKELWTNADSIQEFGYQPESLTQQVPTPIENPAFTDPFGNTIGSSIR